MSQNLTIEIPQSDYQQLMTILDDCLALLNRMEAERPLRDQEHEEHNQRFRETMDEIWARIRRVEKIH